MPAGVLRLPEILERLMPGSRTPLTGAQQLRAIAVDMLVLADVLDEPPADTTAVEQRVGAIEEMAQRTWTVGRGRPPIGWK